jgi:hypothetical protein
MILNQWFVHLSGCAIVLFVIHWFQMIFTRLVNESNYNFKNRFINVKNIRSWRFLFAFVCPTSFINKTDPVIMICFLVQLLIAGVINIIKQIIFYLLKYIQLEEFYWRFSSSYWSACFIENIERNRRTSLLFQHLSITWHSIIDFLPLALHQSQVSAGELEFFKSDRSIVDQF